MILLASLIADAWSTHYLLSRGGREGNPVVRWILDRFGFWPWTALKLGAGWGFVYFAPLTWEIILAAVFFALAFRNLILARR